MKHNLHAIREGTMKVVFLLTACISILAVALICIFLFANGIPTMHKIGLGKFLFGMTWAPNQDLYGIFPMIIASILVTGGAILIGVPLGLLCALYLARFCPKRLYSVLKPAVDLLAGIPSIERSVFSAVFPAARSGILAGIILGVGRAIGETMAVVMIAGNQPILPKSLLSGVRTLTANIVLEMGYATDLHREALIACGVVLFVFILLINLCFSAVKRKADAT